MADRDRRDDRYAGDVYYEVWRSGGNPDAVNTDRIEDYRHDGLNAWEAAGRELRYQRQRHPEEAWDEEAADER